MLFMTAFLFILMERKREMYREDTIKITSIIVRLGDPQTEKVIEVR